jgi:hypothetical protein
MIFFFGSGLSGLGYFRTAKKGEAQSRLTNETKNHSAV